MMSGKTIYEPSCPVTQTTAAVKTLITYHNHGHEPAEMPAFYRLTAEMVLVRSNKGDVYYITTPRSCSCPSATYRPGSQCKHQRKFYPKVTPLAEGPRGDVVDSIRPPGKWHGHNGPVAPEELRPKTLLQEMEAEGYKMSFEPEEVA